MIRTYFLTSERVRLSVLDCTANDRNVLRSGIIIGACTTQERRHRFWDKHERTLSQKVVVRVDIIIS